MIPYGLGALLYAPLTRFFSYRLTLLMAMIVYAIASLAAGLSQSLNFMLFSLVAAGAAGASSTPLSLMLIGDLFEKNIRGRMIGGFFGLSFLSSLAGMIVMGIFDWRWLFFVPAVVAAINALSWAALNQKLLNSCHQKNINYITAFLKPDIRNIFIFIFITSFLYHGVQKWYGVYLSQEYGFGKELVSFVLIAAALCGLLGQQIGGFLSDKRGRLFACYTGLAILAVGIMLLSGHYPFALLTFVLGLITIGWTVCHNSVSTILTDFPDEDRPIMASLNSGVRFVSGGLGFSLSKYFVEKSFSLTFLAFGALIFLLIFYVKLILERSVIKNETTHDIIGGELNG